LSQVDTTKSGDASLIYSTYLGGNKDDNVFGLTLDVSGRVVVTGLTNSTDYPTLNPLFTDPGDNDYDIFVSRLDTSKSGAASLLFSTYLGGAGDDEGFGITTDGSCNIYVAAYTTSTNIPTENAFDDTFGGVADPYVAEIDQDGVPAITSAGTAEGSVGEAFSYTITSDATDPEFSASSLPAGLSLSGDTISGTPSVEGTTNVVLQVKDARCVGTKTLTLSIGTKGSGGCSLVQ